MTNRRPCRLCGVLLEFVPLPSGKTAPINVETGQSHFIDCPGRREFRRVEPPPLQRAAGKKPNTEPEQPRLLDADEGLPTSRPYYQE